MTICPEEVSLRGNQRVLAVLELQKAHGRRGTRRLTGLPPRGGVRGSGHHPVSVGMPACPATETLRYGRVLVRMSRRSPSAGSD